MENYDVIIIGGGPAGVSCAISAKHTYPNKDVAIIRKEEKPMIPCGIPYTINTLEFTDDNILPDTPLNNLGVEIIIDEVIDKRDHVLHLLSGKQLSFEKLVLATGSKAILPPIDGITKEGVVQIKKNRDYLVEVKERVKDANKIIILGGGYIGVEVADEILKVKGKEVKIIEKLDTLFPMTMDSEFGLRAQEEIEKAGGEVLLGESVEKIVGDKNVNSVVLSDGRILEADLVLVAVGYLPNINLARTFDLSYNENQGILVDEYLRSSEHEIFAIGDCAAKFDFFTGEFSNIMLASTAMAEGRLVGSNLFTIKVIRKYIGVLGSFSTKIGNTSFGASGLTENKAKLMNLEYSVGNAISIDRHPGQLPGASKVHVKLIFARYSHTLVGAQVHGGDSVGEMINMLSVMILNKMTDMDIDNLQIGTHPLLTASPIAYPVLTATTDAILKWYVNQTN